MEDSKENREESSDASTYADKPDEKDSTERENDVKKNYDDVELKKDVRAEDGNDVEVEEILSQGVIEVIEFSLIHCHSALM